MSCFSLKPSSTGNEDFLVVTGKTVTIALTGSNAKVLHIRYGSDEIDLDPPYEFTSKSGPKILTVLAEASKPGVVLHLEEVCPDGSRQKLKRFYYDPMSPARGYIIRGKQNV